MYTTKELEKEPEAEQVKTLAVRHPKSKATTSSRTNKCKTIFFRVVFLRKGPGVKSIKDKSLTLIELTLN